MQADHIKILTDAATSDVNSKICASLTVFKSFFNSSSRNEFFRSSSKQGSEEDETVIEEEESSEFIKIVVQLFDPLVRTLKRETSSFVGTFGTEIKILGEDRLKIVDFFLCCIKSDIKEINAAIQTSKALHTIIDLFFTFEQNSILHCLVEQIVSSALSCLNAEDNLRVDLLIEAKLLERISNSSENKGYTGHVIKIANTLLKLSDSNYTISQILAANSDWKRFSENNLKKKNEIEKKTLGELTSGVSEDVYSSEDIEDEVDKKGSVLDSFNKDDKNCEAEEEHDDDDDRNDKPLDIDDLNPHKETSEGQPDEEPNQSKHDESDKQTPDFIQFFESSFEKVIKEERKEIEGLEDINLGTKENYSEKPENNDTQIQQIGDYLITNDDKSIHFQNIDEKQEEHNIDSNTQTLKSDNNEEKGLDNSDISYWRFGSF